jgi:hypothetical protein
MKYEVRGTKRHINIWCVKIFSNYMRWLLNIFMFTVLIGKCDTFIHNFLLLMWSITHVIWFYGFMTFHPWFQILDHYTLVIWVTKNIRCIKTVIFLILSAIRARIYVLAGISCTHKKGLLTHTLIRANTGRNKY